MVAKAKALAEWALRNAGCAAGVTPKSLGRGRAMAYLSQNAIAVVMTKTSPKNQFFTTHARYSAIVISTMMRLPVDVDHKNNMSESRRR